MQHILKNSYRFSPFFVAPIVAGLEKGQPVLATYDSIGCLSANDPFQVGGTASDNLLGPAESFYRPDLSPEELAEVIGQVLLSGIDRDILSGWGAAVYLL